MDPLPPYEGVLGPSKTDPPVSVFSGTRSGSVCVCGSAWWYVDPLHRTFADVRPMFDLKTGTNRPDSTQSSSRSVWNRPGSEMNLKNPVVKEQCYIPMVHQVSCYIFQGVFGPNSWGESASSIACDRMVRFLLLPGADAGRVLSWFGPDMGNEIGCLEVIAIRLEAITIRLEAGSNRCLYLAHDMLGSKRCLSDLWARCLTTYQLNRLKNVVYWPLLVGSVMSNLLEYLESQFVPRKMGIQVYLFLWGHVPFSKVLWRVQSGGSASKTNL